MRRANAVTAQLSLPSPLLWLNSLAGHRTQPVLVPGVNILQVQDPAFPLVEFQILPLRPSFKLPLRGCRALWGTAHSSKICVISKLLRRHLALHPSH